MTDLIEGPAWAPHHLDVRAGRFPLSVEAHLLNMTAKLVPGATTVTINARYYALHGLVALEADRRGLDREATSDLLRRCEVVVAGASVVHPNATAGFAHGHDKVKPRLGADGALDVAGLSTPKSGYAMPRWGFLGPYVGSELTLRILAGTSLEPGSRLDANALREGFPGLFELASQDTVTMPELTSAEALAIGVSSSAPDGAWLARLLCAVAVDDESKVDLTRRGTIRLLARAATVAPGPSITSSFRDLVAYGAGLQTDPVAASTPEAEAWRGTLFRHDSVGAWRRLWAWLVRQINGHTTPTEIIAAMVAALPGGTLADFLDDLPPTVDPLGDPAQAEDLKRGEGLEVPTECLALLALGAQRTRELTGHARAALVGAEARPTVLSPLWMDRWLEDRTGMAMPDVADELVTLLLDRSQRIAMRKMRVGKDGRIWLPTRVHERGDFLYKIGDEGSGNVGLRLDQLAGILAALGVLDRDRAGWSVTAMGDELLDVAGT